MVGNYLHVLIAVFAFILNVISQIIFSRYMKSFNILKTELFGFILGLFSLALAEKSFFSHSMSAKIDYLALCSVNFLIYASLSYCYFHFVNLGETARRVRILREIYESKEGLTFSQIVSRYSSKEILEKRLHRLIDNGQIINKDGKYFINSPVMLLAVELTERLRIILLGKKSEFDK